MPAAKRGESTASAKAGAAAQAEKKNEEHVIEFRGVEIKLPPKLRESVIWRWGILRDGDVGGVARLIQSIIGESAFDEVLQKLDEDEVYVDPDAETSPLGELMEKALAEYGLTPGESQASNGS